MTIYCHLPSTVCRLFVACEEFSGIGQGLRCCLKVLDNLLNASRYEMAQNECTDLASWYHLSLGRSLSYDLSHSTKSFRSECIPRPVRHRVKFELNLSKTSIIQMYICHTNIANKDLLQICSHPRSFNHWSVQSYLKRSCSSLTGKLVYNESPRWRSRETKIQLLKSAKIDLLGVKCTEVDNGIILKETAKYFLSQYVEEDKKIRQSPHGCFDQPLAV